MPCETALDTEGGDINIFAMNTTSSDRETLRGMDCPSILERDVTNR